MLVAHDRWFLEAVGTSVLELEAGRSRFFAGPWHAWRKEQAARELALGRAIDRQKAEIERLERFVTRFRAKATQGEPGPVAREAPGQDGAHRARSARHPRPLVLVQGARALGPGGVRAEDGQVEVPGRTLLEKASLWVERGEHVTLVGSNGSGKTTLIETLAGNHELAAGKLRKGHKVKVGYVSQHAEELTGGGTVLDAAQRATGLTPGKARALLGQFLFSGDDVMKPLDGLSGGELRRLSLAVLVNSDANMLVLDEPTNHLDVESREALEDALTVVPGVAAAGLPRPRAAGRGRLAHVRDRGRHAARIRGRIRGVRGGAGGAQGGRAGAGCRRQAKKAARPARSNGGPSKNAQRAQRELEREIEAAEAALQALEEELADPAAWASPERLGRVERAPRQGRSATWRSSTRGWRPSRV